MGHSFACALAASWYLVIFTGNGAMCTNYMTVTHRPSWQRWLDQLGAEGCTDTDLELPAQPHIFNHYPAPFVR